MSEQLPLMPERFLAIRTVMMPRDTNPQGTVFGGVLLSNIDQAGAVGAWHEARRQGWPEQTIVTVAMNGVEFHEPVYVGDIVSFWTEVRKIGRTSITMHVTVEADHGGQESFIVREVLFAKLKSRVRARKTVPSEHRPVLHARTGLCCFDRAPFSFQHLLFRSSKPLPPNVRLAGPLGVGHNQLL
jgi:acyl-CoA thioesterase YciA